MNEIESFVNSLRAMELPKGAESLLGNILSQGNSLLSERDTLKKALDKREDDNKTARDRIKTLEGDLRTAQDAAPDGDTLAAYAALGKPDEVKASLEQATRDRQAVLTQGNRDAFTKRGIDPEALVHPAFAGAQFSTTGEGETLKTVAKTAEGEKVWEDFVTEKNLTDYLKRFGLTQTVTVVPALAQVGNTQRTDRLATPEEIAESQKNDPKYSI